MNILLGEIIGTALLILLGNGVVANVVLKNTNGNSGGWIVITFGWAIAVFVGVFVSAGMSGAHLNPAVSLGLALMHKIEWQQLPVYFAGQMIGAMLGAASVWATYHQHYRATDDVIAKLATFSTGPAISNPFYNLLTEFK